MKLVLMAIGGLIVAFGLVDFVGSFLHFDLWGRMGVRLPEILWRFSAYIELGIGLVLFRLGKSMSVSRAAAGAEESAGTSTP